MNAGAWFRRLFWRGVLTLTGGISVEGSLPATGCVVVANHSSHADTAALLASLPAQQRPLFVAAADYWGSSHVRRWACRVLGGGYEVRRGGGGSADLAPLVAELRSGRVVVVFPEGTRSRDGSLHAFHSGAVRLAAEAGVPVVPVGLRGTAQLLPVHGEVHRSAIHVRIGEAITGADVQRAQTAVATLVEQPVTVPDSSLRRRIEAFTGTRAFVALVAVWAFAEAVVWPIVPEVLLVLTVLAVPRHWLRWTATALVAGVVGGVATLALAASGVTLPQPLVTQPMRQFAATAVAADGATAVYQQPWSGVPYKVFAASAGEAQVSAGSFAVHSAVARGGRFVLVAGVTALVAVSLRRWRRFYPAAVCVLVAGFSGALWSVVTAWSP